MALQNPQAQRKGAARDATVASLGTEAPAKGMSPEVKAKLAAKAEAKKVARAAVLEYLSQFDQTKADEKQLVDNIMLFVGRPGRTVSARGPVMSPTSALRDMLVAAGTKGVAEIEIYKAFKIGRPEMRIKCRVLVQRAKTPADRVWVTFDAAAEIYRVAGVGALAPKGWTGYVPGEEL